VTVEIGLVFLIIGVALYLFASQRLPLDVSALAVLATLVIIPIVGDTAWLRDRGVDLPAAFPTVAEGLSGLSNPATVTVLAMFILSAGVQRSGLIHVLGKKIVPFVGNSEARVLIVTAVLVGLLSGFVNNTAAVAVAIPLMLDLARKLDLQASRLLLPLSFFGMLGGMLTLIGTSTNILAAALLADDPDVGRSIGMFEFTHVGALVLAFVGGAFEMTKTAATGIGSTVAYLTVILSHFILAWGSALLGLAITGTLHDPASYLGGLLLTIAVPLGFLFVFAAETAWDLGFWVGLTMPYGVAWLVLGLALVMLFMTYIVFAGKRAGQRVVPCGAGPLSGVSRPKTGHTRQRPKEL
jgi:hypothetical protein